MALVSDRKPLIVLVAGAAVIGLAAVLVRLTGTGAAAAGFWRLSFALPMLALLSWRERDGRAAQGRTRPAVFLLAGFTFAADLVCWHYSLHLTSVANSTVLANLTPVAVTLVAWLAFKERPTVLFLMGLTLAVGGAATMALTRGGGGQGSDPPLGNLISLGAMTWYAAYFLLVRQARKTASAMRVMLWSSLVGAPITLAAALALHETILPQNALGWAACAGLGIVHVTGQGAIAWALGKLPTPLAAVVVLVQPVVATLLSWMLFGEAVTVLQVVGGSLALGGVAVAQLSARRRPAPAIGEAEALG